MREECTLAHARCMKKLSTSREIWFIVLFILLLYLPTWMLTQGKYFRLDTDFDGSLPTFYFLVDYVDRFRALPSWNPYVASGIPVLGDPVSVVANPILTGAIIMFGVETGLRLTIGIIFFLAAVSMWWFLKSIGIRGWIRIWGALLFATSGNMIAYIRSGHLQELLTYPTVPLLTHFVLKKAFRRRDVIVFSLVLSYVWYSGYTYLLWFTLIFATVTWFYRSLNRSSRLSMIALFRYMLAAGLFIIFTGPKTYQFVYDVRPNFERFLSIYPMLGSIHSLWYPIGLVMPLQTMFYDRPFFQRLFGFSYNWFEYYAFITPLPFFFLVSFRSVVKKPIVALLVTILVTSVLYIALRYPYSPFYWLFRFVPFAQTFRVPSRIYGPSMAGIIALLVLCANAWFAIQAPRNKRLFGILICVGTIVWTGMTTQYSLVATFEKPRTIEPQIARQLREADSGAYYVATFVCCLQTFLVREHIPIINYYYAWRPKQSPNFIRSDNSGPNYDVLFFVRPTYVIGPALADFTKYGYAVFQSYPSAIVWKTNKPSIVPTTI